jgi:hypothetical protein
MPSSPRSENPSMLLLLSLSFFDVMRACQSVSLHRTKLLSLLAKCDNRSTEWNTTWLQQRGLEHSHRGNVRGVKLRLMTCGTSESLLRLRELASSLVLENGTLMSTFLSLELDARPDSHRIDLVSQTKLLKCYESFNVALTEFVLTTTGFWEQCQWNLHWNAELN